MIGSRIGSKGGLIGSAIGSSSDDEGVGGIPGVTRDNQSLVYYPANTTEWTTFLAAVGLSGVVGIPSLLWNLQDASGNFADSIGTFTGVVSGTAFGYQQPLAGSSRKGITTTAAATTMATNTDAGLPDLLTNSLTSLSVGAVTGTAATRIWQALGTPVTALMRHNTTPSVQSVSGANVANSAVAPLAVLEPFVTKHNRTASAAVGYNKTSKMVPTFDVTVTGKSYQMFGDATVRCPTATWLYNCAWFNAAAEMSDATIKSLLVAMGHPILWF